MSNTNIQTKCSQTAQLALHHVETYQMTPLLLAHSQSDTHTQDSETIQTPLLVAFMLQI